MSAGTYAERIVIEKSDILLKGIHAVVDGESIGGTGTGIRVLGSSNVSIQGFTVVNFERGIVLINTENCRVKSNVVVHNTDKDPDDGCFNNSDGIVLQASHGNYVVGNQANNNGHNGIFLIEGSSENVLRGNAANDNGAQTQECGVVAGCGIQLSGGDNNDNDIISNTTERNAWGILLGPGGGASGNFVGQNRSHENRRAGIAARGDATENDIFQNNAKGNGLFNLAPSEEFDLFDDSAGDNNWKRNQGTSNF